MANLLLLRERYCDVFVWNVFLLRVAWWSGLPKKASSTYVEAAYAEDDIRSACRH
jgi:hypothetical protein